MADRAGRLLKAKEPAMVNELNPSVEQKNGGLESVVSILAKIERPKTQSRRNMGT